MSWEDYVHLPRVQDNSLGRLRTFWCRRNSLISPIQCNDPCDDSLAFSMTHLSWQYG